MRYEDVRRLLEADLSDDDEAFLNYLWGLSSDEPEPGGPREVELIDLNDGGMGELYKLMDPEDAIDSVVEDILDPNEWEKMRGPDFRDFGLPETTTHSRPRPLPHIQKGIDALEREIGLRSLAKLTQDELKQELVKRRVMRRIDDEVFQGPIQHRGWYIEIPDGVRSLDGEDIPALTFVIFDKGSGKYRYDILSVLGKQNRNRAREFAGETSLKSAMAHVAKVYRTIGKRGWEAVNRGGMASIR